VWPAPRGWPCHTSEDVQIQAALSAPAVMTRLPSPLIKAACTAPSVGKNSSIRPLRAYSRATLSAPPTISRLPSGLKPTLRTSAGVVTVTTGLPSAAFPTLTTLSAPPLARCLPSLLRARHRTPPACSRLSLLSPPGSDQDRTVLSALAE